MDDGRWRALSRRPSHSEHHPSDDRPVRDLGVLYDDDDAVADVEAGALPLLDAVLVCYHAVAADGGVEVDDRVLDQRPLPDAGASGALDGLPALGVLPRIVVRAQEHGAVEVGAGADVGADAD